MLLMHVCTGTEDFLNFELPAVLAATKTALASEEMAACWLKTEPEHPPPSPEPEDAAESAYIVFQPTSESAGLAWHVADWEWSNIETFRQTPFAEKCAYALQHVLAYHVHKEVDMPTQESLQAWQKFVQ